MAKDHEHRWIYDGKSCCYRLKCSVKGCDKVTKVYHFDGNDQNLQIGTPVSILADEETFVAIGSIV